MAAPRKIAAWKQLLALALLIGAAAAVWIERDALRAMAGLTAAPTAGDKSRGRPAVPVIVAPITIARNDIAFEAIGTGRAQRSVMLRVETAGKVAAMPLAPGKRFEKGDVLLKLDDADQRLAVRLAETRLAEAERARKRYRRLQRSGNAAAVRLDEAQTAAAVARIELAMARAALAKRVLRAPFAGVSGLTEIEVGAWVDSDIEIASFDDRNVILVGFDLPEALIGRIAPGMAVAAFTPAAPGRRFDGVVAAIDSRIAAADRTAKVRVAIPNPDDILRPGASFKVRLTLPGGRFPMAPELAVHFSRGALHVWRVVEDKAERVEVRMVRRLDGMVLVEGPLAEGDRVVVEGAQRLAPGKAVEILRSRQGGGA